MGISSSSFSARGGRRGISKSFLPGRGAENVKRKTDHTPTPKPDPHLAFFAGHVYKPMWEGKTVLGRMRARGAGAGGRQEHPIGNDGPPTLPLGTRDGISNSSFSARGGRRVIFKTNPGRWAEIANDHTPTPKTYPHLANFCWTCLQAHAHL